MCDASGNADDVYIDEIEWRGMGGMSSLASTEPVIPEKFELSQNYPNPFNPTTTISFSLPTASDVSLVVYNILGQKVVSLAEGFYPPGHYDVVFDAAEYSSGVYFYRLTRGRDIETKKMMLVK